MPDSRSEVFERLAVVGKAFAHATRLELIDLLAQGERTVDALAREAGTGVTSVSAHLQVLKLAHLVRTRREGTHIYYRLADDAVASLYAALAAVARTQSSEVERALAAYLGAGAVEEVDRQELQRRLDAGAVSLIDVRPREEYDAGHIPGATSAPIATLLEAASEWDPAGEIVAYCRGAHCVLAHDAVRLLAAHGFRTTRLRGGMLEWRVSGGPVAVDSSPRALEPIS